MSMYISVLGIGIELYGHVLGPSRVSCDSEKIYIYIYFSVFKPFFNGLNGKYQNVKKL